jgi:hypothetical protein
MHRLTVCRTDLCEDVFVKVSLEGTHFYSKDTLTLRRKRCEHVAFQPSQHERFQLRVKLFNLILMISVTQIEFVRQSDCGYKSIMRRWGRVRKETYTSPALRSASETRALQTRQNMSNRTQDLLSRVTARTFHIVLQGGTRYEKLRRSRARTQRLVQLTLRILQAVRLMWNDHQQVQCPVPSCVTHLVNGQHLPFNVCELLCIPER